MDKLIRSLIRKGIRLNPANLKHGYNRFHTSSKRYVELTSVRYPKLKRGNYSRVTDADIALFERILPGAERVITDPSELEGYNTDWIKNCRGIVKVQLKLPIFNISTLTISLLVCLQPKYTCTDMTPRNINAQTPTFQGTNSHLGRVEPQRFISSAQRNSR